MIPSFRYLSNTLIRQQAHCTICEDASANRFLIATGITRDEGTSSCVVWAAEEVVNSETFSQVAVEDDAEEAINKMSAEENTPVSTQPVVAPFG